jgi:DNA-binding PadR family transcriptional regulator
MVDNKLGERELFPPKIPEEELEKITTEFFKSPKKIILRMMILLILDEHESHGYQMMKLIEEKTKNIWKPSEYLLYGELNKMEKNQLIIGKEDHKGEISYKLYNITKEGKKQTMHHMLALARLFDFSEYQKDGKFPFFKFNIERLMKAINQLPPQIRLTALNDIKTNSQIILENIDEQIQKIKEQQTK